MYLVNNLKNNNENTNEGSCGCIESGCPVRCCGDRAMVTEKNLVLKVICVVQPDATTM